LREDLSKELGEVGEILSEEAGLENESLSGVVGVQLAAEEFGFSCDPESRALGSVL